MNNASVYEIITDRIVRLLEDGVVPWRRPWAGPDDAPKNVVSRKDYRGVNAFLLSAMGYESPYWLTFKQAKALGGSVRKGERSTPVVFWKWIERASEDPETGETETKKIPLVRYYNVFNAEQCDGLTHKRLEAEQDEPAPEETTE